MPGTPTGCSSGRPARWAQPERSGKTAVMDDGWYFCLDHRRVEPRLGCRDAERLGPYPTREEAEQALETAQRRNAAWDNDPRWNEDE